MSSEVSAVYANALFSLANEQGDAVMQETRSDLRQTAVLFSLNPDLTRLLSLPTVSVEERLGIAKKIFGETGLAAKLLFLLIDHNRVPYLRRSRACGRRKGRRGNRHRRHAYRYAPQEGCRADGLRGQENRLRERCLRPYTPPLCRRLARCV